MDGDQLRHDSLELDHLDLFDQFFNQDLDGDYLGDLDEFFYYFLDDLLDLDDLGLDLLYDHWLLNNGWHLNDFLLHDYLGL